MFEDYFSTHVGSLQDLRITPNLQSGTNASNKYSKPASSTMTESLSVAVLYQGTCRCWRNLHQKQWGCCTALGMTGGKNKTQWARKTETPSVWYSLDKVLTWSWPGSIMLYTCKLPRLLVRPLLLSVHLQKPSACVLPRSPKNTHTHRFSLSLPLAGHGHPKNTVLRICVNC